MQKGGGLSQFWRIHKSPSFISFPSFSDCVTFFPCSRQLALKALNERLSKVDQTANWPNMEEMEATPPTTPETQSISSDAPLDVKLDDSSSDVINVDLPAKDSSAAKGADSS